MRLLGCSVPGPFPFAFGLVGKKTKEKGPKDERLNAFVGLLGPRTFSLRVWAGREKKTKEKGPKDERLNAFVGLLNFAKGKLDLSNDSHAERERNFIVTNIAHL